MKRKKKNRNNKNTKTNEQIQVSSLLPLANQGKGYKIFLKYYNYKVEALYTKMYTKQLSKFEKGKKLEIAVCNVQKIEKNTKKAHAIVNNTEIFKNLLKKNLS